MPCYSVRTVSIEFKIGNIDLLKKALEKTEYIMTSASESQFNFRDLNYNRFTINFNQSKISSSDCNEKMISLVSNSIKRAYSECVVDEIARKQKWIKKKMGEGRYQLQRF